MDILTAKEVAKLLKVSERTVSDWAQKGEIPCGKIGGSWRFKRGELERWVNKRLGEEQKIFHAPTVEIDDVLKVERVLFLDLRCKRDVLDALVECLADSPRISDRDELSAAVFQREAMMSTGIGLGIAVPHVRLASVDGIVMAAAVLPGGVEDYESLDGQPVQLVFMVAAGSEKHADHLKLLASLTGRLKDEGVRRQLVESPDATRFYATLLHGSGDSNL